MEKSQKCLEQKVFFLSAEEGMEREGAVDLAGVPSSVGPSLKQA